MATYNVLTFGAAYGSLLATKLLFGGHKITMVCLPAEIEAFNTEGARVRLPIRGRKEPIELDSRKLPGSLKAAGPGDVNPKDYDLVALQAAGLSPMARSFYDDNKRVANRQIKTELGVRLHYPDYRTGLAAIRAEETCSKTQHPASSGEKRTRPREKG